MLVKLQKKWKTLLEKLNPQTGVCRICCQDIYEFQLNLQGYKDKVLICESCWKQFSPIWQNFTNRSFKGLAIYDYNDFMKEKIFIHKGCFDYELGKAFLSRYINILKLLYRGYTIVPIPSWWEDDQERGFNHVEEIFSVLGLPMIKCLLKKENHKQSDQKGNNRNNIKKIIDIQNKSLIYEKNILLVDDVYTTGKTISCAIELLELCHPKQIKILVLSTKCRKKGEKGERK